LKVPKKTAKIISPIFIFLLAAASQAQVDQLLTLTVATDNPTYHFGHPVTIYGNLTLNETPTAEGLIGLQIEDPKKILTLRAFSIGNPPSPIVEILNIFPCDQWGNPKNEFPKKSLAFFYVSLKNNDYIEAHDTLLCVSIYDSSGAPLSASTWNGLILEKQTLNLIISVPIPEKPAIGNATAYATLFTQWPKLGGTPYTTEYTTTFNITGSGTVGTPPTPKAMPGNYNITIRIPEYEAVRGTYTIYVTAYYLGAYAQNSTTFYVSIPGDANNDGRVSGADLAMLAYSWGSKIGDPNYLPQTDFNGDGLITGTDLAIMAKYWGYIA
jgi:hypothetical protein